jgi:hypothetical protein
LASRNVAGIYDYYVSNRKARMVMIKAQQAAPMGKPYRVSSDSAFPLRNSQGLTFAEAKRLREQGQGK